MFDKLLSTNSKGDITIGIPPIKDLMMVGVVEGGIEDGNLQDNENTNGNKTERSNLGENLLQVGVAPQIDKRSIA